MVRRFLEKYTPVSSPSSGPDVACAFERIFNIVRVGSRSARFELLLAVQDVQGWSQELPRDDISPKSDCKLLQGL